MKKITIIVIILLFSAVSFGSPDLSGQYWFGSLSIDVDTNAPLAKRGTVTVAGNQWDQQWEDYNGRHEFSSAFTTTVEPDGSVNVNFADQTYNVAWNGGMMIHAGTVLHGVGEGIDIFTRKASEVDVNDLVGDGSFFAHWLGTDHTWDEAAWGTDGIDANGLLYSDWVSSVGDEEYHTGTWTLDDANSVLHGSFGPPTLLGESGIHTVFQVDPDIYPALGYYLSIELTDEMITINDIAGTYQVRSFQTGPGYVPYTCDQGTCVIEAVDDANGIIFMDAYYSNGRHDVRSIDCSIGPGNELHLDDVNTPDAIISIDKNLVFIPSYRNENLPTRSADDWIGGIFFIRTPDNIAGPGSSGLDNFSWARRVASNTGAEENIGMGMALDAQSNVYVTGWFDGTNDFGGVTLASRNGGGQDIFVAKYSTTGVLQWVQRAGGSADRSSENDAGRDVDIDVAGNVYVTGQFRSMADFGEVSVTAGSSGSCFFLAKYDPNGVAQWVRHNACAPDRYCAGDGLTVDASGNCYVVGSFDGEAITFGDTTITNASNYVNRYLVKYDDAGVVHWAIGITSTIHSMVGRVCLDRDGSVYVTGVFRSDIHIGHIILNASNSWNSFVAKLDGSGVPLWAQVITSDSGVRAFDVRADHLDGVYVSGAFGTFAGTTASFAPSVTLTSMGGGSSGASEGDAVGDAFVAKYDATTGELIWARRAGGTGMDAFPSVTTDAQGNIYTAGGFMSGGDVGEFTVPTNQNWHIVVAKYDPNGTVQELNYAESTGMGLAMSLAVDPEGNSYISGWYQGLATFGTNVLESDNVWNYFLAKLAGM